MKDTVCVYMSTYNGEKYLKEQLDSILNQKGVKVIICIRDDGSQDNTVSIIKEYIRDGKPIILECGENVGFPKSFMTANHHKVDADYYAFSDQDDVWKENKLIRAKKLLKSSDGPALYGGNIIVTDENLKYNGVWCTNKNYKVKKERILRYYSLGYNLYGCSMVWNRKLQELIWQHMPRNIVSHDVYITMLAGALGKIIVDKKPMTLHRIHRNNTAGIEANCIRRCAKGYRLYWGKGHRKLSEVAKEIIDCYGNYFNKMSDCGIKNLVLMSRYRDKKCCFIKQLDVNLLGKTRYLWQLFLLIFNKY